MQRRNFIKEKLNSGKAVIGTWSIIPSTIVSDIISSTGIDFIIIDAEHGPISFSEAQQMAIACESRGVSPIMRVGGIIESDILKALDIGVHGIQIPNVEKTADVERIIRFSKYPPIGNRGFSPFTRAGNYSIKNSKNHTATSNQNTLIGINVEGEEGINNLDEILQINELDIIFIGLFDLSKALGIPGEVDNPKVEELLKDVSKKILNAGKYPGTIATSKEKMRLHLSIGIKYLLYLVDCEMIRASYEDVVFEFDKLK